MIFVRNCIGAIFTPWGRLPAGAFAIMCFAIIGAHAGLQLYITGQGDDLEPYNPYAMAMFGLLWTSFCVLSRRFHDASKTAFFLVPLLIVAFVVYLKYLDYMPLAGSDFIEDQNLALLAARARFAVQALGLVMMVVAILGQGDIGANSFGPVFYERKKATRDVPAAHAALPRAAEKLAASAPTHDRRVEPAPREKWDEKRRQEFLASGPRGKITPAESTRHKASGFGRR